MDASGKKVLITGGGSGIGLALAKAFVDAGATVVVCGRNQKKLEKAEEAVPQLEALTCDVTNMNDVKSLVASINDRFGGVDILVNNAGIFQSFDYKTGDLSIDQQLKEVDIDLNGPIRLANELLPDLLKRGEAAIVNVSSALAFVPLAYAPVYCATKAALHSWSRSLRYQLQKTSVKVFELMPPLVETEMVGDFKGSPMMQPDKLAAKFMSGFKADKYEITPGQTGQLKMMSKLAPGFIFKALNKSFAK